MGDDKQFLSIEEVADLLGVHYQLVYRLVREGELPAAKVGRVYRVDRADLMVYLDSRKATSGRIRPTCAACGRCYALSSMVAEGCLDCSAGICVDCWTRQGLRQCRVCAGDETK